MSMGAHWDDDGTARLWADGGSGRGELSGLQPDTLMYFAVILARNARAHGAPWPSAAILGDPYEAVTVEALKVAVGEREPLTDEQLGQPKQVLDNDVLRQRVDDATDQLSSALNKMAGVLETLSRTGEMLGK